MSTTTLAVGVCLLGDELLDLAALARACNTQADAITALVDEGLLQPVVEAPAWRFGGDELARARRILRLQRDFDANLHSVAVMVQLLDEIDRLHAWARREGLRLPDPAR
jgi:chaperone modulatory protein CbpM